MKLATIGLLAVACLLVGGGCDADRSDGGRVPSPLRANEVITVADDFIVEVYLNGVRLPDAQRELLEELHGATAERISVKVRQDDWLVFHVVNNRLRWGGAYYFGVAGILSTNTYGFVSDSTSGEWSVCDSPKLAERFITKKGFMNDNSAVVVENPWGNGTSVMKRFAGEAWSGEPIWGKERSTWIKIAFR